ncbi:hypothetical protein ACFL27_20845 [candidate division CSSED10-310 bacterium]|uniref:Lipoprotein n=1 Tax=candidate division CSSED10-310 bacterium TaxID=2855610 RepID=A0ABV6Z2H2_UNCC1
MKRLLIFNVIVVILGLFIGCVSMNKLSVPPAVLDLNPELDCQQFANPDSYNLKGELLQIEEKTYLIILLDPGYRLRSNPWVELKGGFAIYEGKRDKMYYFTLGKLVKSEEIGLFGFETNLRVTNHSGNTDYENRVFRLVRKEGSTCLLMYPVSNPNFQNATRPEGTQSDHREKEVTKKKSVEPS